MTFWLGVFAGLTVLQVFNLVLSVVLFGNESEIDEMSVGLSLTLAVLFGTVAWWVATFGGGA